MSTSKLVLTLAIAAAAAAPLAATAGTKFINERGELGFQLPDTPSTLTRVQKIAQDRAQAAAEAAQLSGWKWVGGQLGWAYEGHKYALVDGKLVCVDGIDHNAKTSVSLADESLYIGI